jgi:hypothetical protein
VCEPHLDFLPFTSRLLKAVGASERPGDVSGVLMDIARDLARWVLWTALRFEWTYIAVELAGAIQKGLALMHGTTRAKSLPARAVINVARRVISKVAAREGAVVPLRFVEHRNMGCDALLLNPTDVPYPLPRRIAWVRVSIAPTTSIRQAHRAPV